MLPNALRIAVYPGDGIGREVIDIARAAPELLERQVGGFKLTYEEHAAGVTCRVALRLTPTYGAPVE